MALFKSQSIARDAIRAWGGDEYVDSDEPFRTASGLNVIQAVEDIIPTLGAVSTKRAVKANDVNPLFSVTAFQPFPKELLDLFKAAGGEVEQSSDLNVGLVGFLHQAYFVTDNKIVFWDLKTHQMAYYEEMHDAIIDVVYLHTATNTLGSARAHALVLCTQQEMLVLSCAFDTNGLLQVTPTSFVVPLRDIHVTKLATSACGRVFVGGEDSYVYELVFRKQGAWPECEKAQLVPLTCSAWGKTMRALIPNALRSIVHPIVDLMVDNKRGILYTLNTIDDIEGWVFQREGGSAVTSIGRVSGVHIHHQSRNPGEDSPSEDSYIAALLPNPITRVYDSANPTPDLIAITNTGRRVYITATGEQERALVRRHTTRGTSAQAPASGRQTANQNQHTLKQADHSTYMKNDEAPPHPRAHANETAHSQALPDMGADYTYRIVYRRLVLLSTKFVAPTPDPISVSQAVFTSAAFVANTNALVDVGQLMVEDAEATNDDATGAVLCVGPQYATGEYQNELWADAYTYLLDTNTTVVEVQANMCTELLQLPNLTHASVLRDNEMLRQYWLPANTYSVMCSDGIYTITKARPIDQLKKIMSDKTLAEKYTAQSHHDAAMLIALICEADLDTAVVKRMLKAFFSATEPPQTGALLIYRTVPPLSTYNNYPNTTYNKATYGSSTSTTTVHIDGLALYVKRLLTPIQELGLFRVRSTVDQDECVLPSLNDSELKLMVSKLQRLSAFLNSHTIMWQRYGDEALEAKHNLSAVVALSLQFLHLSDILICNVNRSSFHNFNDPQFVECLRDMQRLTLTHVLSDNTAFELLRRLTLEITYTCLLNADIETKTAMRNDLLRSCGSFFDTSDSVTLEVYLNLQQLLDLPVADHELSPNNRVRKTAMRIIETFLESDNMDLNTLTKLCEKLDLIRVRHRIDLSTDIVETCLRVAYKLRIRTPEDIENEMRHRLNTHPHTHSRHTHPHIHAHTHAHTHISGVDTAHERVGSRKRPADAMSGGASGHSGVMRWRPLRSADTDENAKQRLMCYELVFDYLLDYNERGVAVPKHGPLHAAIRSDNSEFVTILYERFAENVPLHTYLVRLAPKDPTLLHNFLYHMHTDAMDMIYRRNLSPQGVCEQLARAELVCTRESVIGHPHTSAQLMESMAVADGDIDIQKRIEYLRKALAFAKATPMASPMRQTTDFQDLLSDLECRIQLAEIQLSMCAEVQAGIANVLIKNGSDYKALQASLRSLRYDMLDVTQLYKKHAEPLHMHDMCLRLMQIADYKDSQKVNELWQRILLQADNYAEFIPILHTLGSALKGTEYLPWAHIVDRVHLRWAKHSYDQFRGKSHLYQTLNDYAGISLVDLLRHYCDMKIRMMDEESVRAQLHEIIESIVDTLTTTINTEERITAEDCSELTAIAQKAKRDLFINEAIGSSLDLLLTSIERSNLLGR